MRPDRVEISWDEGKSSWLVRIEVGEEVVRRHVGLAKNADEQALRAAAKKAVEDEGYEAGTDPGVVTIRR